MKKEEEKQTTKPRYGTVNFERRKYPRFNVDLPVEYSKPDLISKPGRATNVSEGGLLLYFPERMEIGQHLSLKLFFSFGLELKTIETLVQVVWMDIDPGKDWGEYRTGVKFLDISPESLDTLKSFLKSLLG
jgi:c-di-GMP-binding flagellar brake protein YcgR